MQHREVYKKGQRSSNQIVSMASEQNNKRLLLRFLFLFILFMCLVHAMNFHLTKENKN